MSVTYTVEYPMISMEAVEQSRSVHGFMGSLEQRAFMFHLGMSSRWAAEVGTYCGLSAVLVGLGMKNCGRYFCIDTFEASNAELTKENTLAIWQQNITRFGLEHTCVPVRGWSFDPAVYAQVPGNLDFVYIDGDHETASVLLDALMYRQKVRPNGLLLFHDIPWPKVKAALDQLVKMEMMTVVRTFDDFGVYRATDYQSSESRELLASLLAAPGKTS